MPPMLPPGPPQAPNVIPFPGGGGNVPPQMPFGAAQGLTGEVLPSIDPTLQPKLEAVARIAKAIGLLRNEKLRGFRVDIEVDSQIYGDMAEEKAERNEFVVATTAFLEKAMMIGASLPEAIPLMGRLLKFGVRGHKIGRDLEAAIEEFTEETAAKVKERLQQQALQPNPEQMKAQVEMMKAKSQVAKDQASIQAAQVKTQADAQKNMVDLQTAQLDQQTAAQQSAAEIERQRVENEGERANSAIDAQIKHAELLVRLEELKLERERVELERQQMYSEAQIYRQEHKSAERVAEIEGDSAETVAAHEEAAAKHEADASKEVAKHQVTAAKHESNAAKTVARHETTTAAHEATAAKHKATAAANQAKKSAQKPKPKS